MRYNHDYKIKVQKLEQVNFIIPETELNRWAIFKMNSLL